MKVLLLKALVVIAFFTAYLMLVLLVIQLKNPSIHLWDDIWSLIG